MHRLKYLRLAIMISVCYIMSSCASSRNMHDQESIRNVLKKYEEAYNMGDPKSLSNLWDDVGDLYTLSGGIFRGRAEVEVFWTEVLSRNYKGSKTEYKIDGIRYLSENIAMVDGTWKIIGDNLPEGYPTAGIYTFVLVKKLGVWMINAARPSVPLKGHTRNHGRK